MEQQLPEWGQQMDPSRHNTSEKCELRTHLLNHDREAPTPEQESRTYIEGLEEEKRVTVHFIPYM